MTDDGGADDSNGEMVAAVEAADEVTLSALLSSPKQGSATLRAALGVAAARGNVRAVALLLDAGADPNLEHDDLDPPLLLAITNGHELVVKLLLESGASPESHAGTPFLSPYLSALQEAAAGGRTTMVELLLEHGADPEGVDVMGHGQPLFQAGLRGHEDTAQLIHNRVIAQRQQRSRAHFEERGYAVVPDRSTRPVLFLSGSHQPAHRDFVADRVVAPKPEAAPEIPFTAYDGFAKQVDQARMNVVLREALDTLFPVFTVLGLPSPGLLPRLPRLDPRRGERQYVHLARERRFAGDNLLPRGRYHALCDEDGADDRTVCNELFAYRHVGSSDAIALLDPSHPVDRVLVDPPLIHDRQNPVLLVALHPTAGRINKFLRRAGLEQKEWWFRFPVQVNRLRLAKVVDLRQPVTQQWFTAFFSGFIDDISGWAPAAGQAVRWWPDRPVLDHFEQILPSLLTQELGGNVVTKAVGSWLRRSGAEALIYPSARSDVELRIADGAVKDARGWNLARIFRRAVLA